MNILLVCAAVKSKVPPVLHMCICRRARRALGAAVLDANYAQVTVCQL